jgi:hypothetical protein
MLGAQAWQQCIALQVACCRTPAVLAGQQSQQHHQRCCKPTTTITTTTPTPSEAQEGVKAGVQGLGSHHDVPELLRWQPQQLREVLVDDLYHLLRLCAGQIKVVLDKEWDEARGPLHMEHGVL